MVQALAVVAGADAPRISYESTQAGVHGGDEEEIAGEDECPSDPHEVNALFLERLADRFEDVASELGELV